MSVSFLKYSKVREYNNPKYGEILNDIESHIDDDSVYKDECRVTTAHECVHYLNSILRQKHYREGQYNCFYCLQDRYVKLLEPPTTIKEVAKTVPSSLRGNVYNLYLVQQANSWNDTHLYIFDEWMGYSNGTACVLDLLEKGLWQGRRADTVGQMIEFNIYALCLLRVIYGTDYDDYDANIKKFMSWNLTRTFNFYRMSKQYSETSDDRHDEYISKFKSDSLSQFYLEQFSEVESLLHIL